MHARPKNSRRAVVEVSAPCFSDTVAYMPTAEIRAAREAYENAINEFSDASGIMYRHALDGTQPTQAEIDRYTKAEVAPGARKASVHRDLAFRALEFAEAPSALGVFSIDSLIRPIDRHAANSEGVAHKKIDAEGRGKSICRLRGIGARRLPRGQLPAQFAELLDHGMHGFEVVDRCWIDCHR